MKLAVGTNIAFMLMDMLCGKLHQSVLVSWSDENISCIAAIACDGLVAIETTATTVNATTFFDFVHGSLIPNMFPFNGSNPCFVAVMENLMFYSPC